ncbi:MULTISPECIES: beta-galactosidase [Bacillaceae]|uniref:Beta-galactosidase n=1 Tax=Evansella alkalicola TaxID=745819 RepID=A0ABS6JYN0_9BACI|nr:MULTISPECIES: beta-galactosidase [Bacillaceae]MBU9723196.1 beta-galactosidase [Bacillus alkalicola]
MKKFVQNEEFQLGVCYYPEHWPEELWADDYRRMKEMHFSTVRLAEFAWAIFEPSEGEFSFELFDRAIDLAHEHGLKVVLGTPTATPPAWLTHKYPEVLNSTQEGVQFQHGLRRHYNYNAEIYHQFSARIVRKMVEHYRNHPAVIGWQLDNEFNCEVDVFYSDADHKAFQNWVKKKYETLDNVNQAWGTVFWSQTYTSWEQIHLPRPNPSQSQNPHLALDEKRFISDSTIAYAKLQADIIREVAPHQWITTNGLYGHIDNHQMTEDLLDFFAYDSYPNFSTIFPDKGKNPLLDRKWGWNLSNVRSVSSTFGVFEQQSGPGGWVNRMQQPSPKPGQMRLWTYQSIAHGADMLLYFRWRTATMGTETYWHGINDYHNQPNRRVDEAKTIGRELNQIGNDLLGAEYQAEVAIVRDYDNEWDGELDLWHGPFSDRSNTAWFKALQYSHVPSDVAYINDHTTLADLNQYTTLIYPHPAIMTERTSELLEAFVKAGGNVIFGCRTGYKDKTGQCYMKPFPGVVSELCGVTVDEFSLHNAEHPAPSVKTRVGTFQSDGFSEVLQVQSENAEVIGSYSESHVVGKPALVKNSVGNGTVYYFGGVFTEESASFLLEELQITSPVESWLVLPQKVELAIRKDQNGKEFIFLLNYSDSEQTIQVKNMRTNLLTGEALQGEVVMEPYGVVIL